MHVWTRLRPEAVGRTGIGLYPDGMVEHDDQVGTLLAELDELGIAADGAVGETLPGLDVGGWRLTAGEVGRVTLVPPGVRSAQGQGWPAVRAEGIVNRNRRAFVKTSAGALAGLSLSSCRSESGGVAGADTIVFRNGAVSPVDTGFSEHAAFAIQGNRVLAVAGRNAPVFMLGALLQHGLAKGMTGPDVVESVRDRSRADSFCGAGSDWRPMKRLHP